MSCVRISEHVLCEKLLELNYKLPDKPWTRRTANLKADAMAFVINCPEPLENRHALLSTIVLLSSKEWVDFMTMLWCRRELEETSPDWKDYGETGE